MPLNMTKIAFGRDSLQELATSLKQRGQDGNGRVHLTTRYRPKRHAEMIGGSLYWIIQHRLMGRSEILAFEDAPDGRTHIVIEAGVTPVHPKAKRAHQGWRYLKPEDAPADLEGDAGGLTELPPKMLGELTKLGLV